jgi:hypothetical protein
MLAFPALVAFGSVWLALAVMLVWSLGATSLLCFARERGVPDLFARRRTCVGSKDGRVRLNLISACVICVVGLQAFAFARASRPILRRRDSRLDRAMRAGVLLLGLTLFGATVAHHLLHEAGFRQSRLVRFSLLAPFLNVPYHTLVSAGLNHVIWCLLRLFV